jgi:hypothetical protein
MRASLKRIACAVFSLLLCCGCALPAAYAAAPPDLKREDCSFTIVMQYGGAAIPGAGIGLYRVADTRIEGGRLAYDATPDFAAAGADLGDLSPEKNLAAAALLRDFAAQNGVAGISNTTGADGKAAFAPLTAGLYLVAQTGAAGGYYNINPFLLSVPMADASGTGWAYDIESQPKTEIVRPTPNDPGGSDPSPDPDPTPDPDPEPTPEPEPEPEPEPTPEPEPGPTPPVEDGHDLVPGPDGRYIEMDENGVPLGEWRWDEPTEQWIFDEYPPLAEMPQTGQLRWPIPVMAVAGMVLFAIGWAIKRGQEANEPRATT